MLTIRKKKGRRGFVLIYVLFVGCICISIVSVGYKMEFVKRDNAVKLQNNTIKVDKLQKSREYLLSRLDKYILNNINSLSNEEIQTYFSTLNDFKVVYEGSYIIYIKDKNYFLLRYYLNNKFCKEELYEYKVTSKGLVYGCIDYSFKEGEIK